MKVLHITCALLLSVGFAGCGSDDDDEPNIDVEGCEHLKEGPAVAVTAATSTTGAPAVSNDHKRYDVTLVDVTGGKGGSVSFAADEATDFIFFLNADVPVQFLDATGAAATPESSVNSSTVCTDIRKKHTVPLKVGTYALSFGPTTQSAVSVVIEEAGHVH